jgi:transposase
MLARKQDNKEVPVLKLLQQIKSKTLSPKLVSRETRPLIIGYLILDGWSHPQIAQLFECSEKTIQRDLKDFETIHKVLPGVEFIHRKVGYFLAAAENQIAALLRIARSPNASNPEKIASEVAAWKIRVDAISKLQSLGYLPIQASQVNANIVHHLSDAQEQSPQELRVVLDDLERDGKEAGVLDQELEKRIQAIRIKIQQLDVTQEISKIKTETENKENRNESAN